jgi:hypothetical protein
MSQALDSVFTVPTTGISLPGGVDIAEVLKSEGPVVTAVLLKADATIEQVQVDTTPHKQMVQKILGGPFTFLGQYEEEGTVLMCLRSDDNTVPLNEHKLQPPFEESQVRGDILCLRVAAQEEGDDDNVDTIANKTNEEFFLNYTKEEYIRFAARTDIEAPNAVVSEDAEDDEDDLVESDNEEGEMEGESDEDDDEDGAAGFIEMLMGQVIQRFHQENGRMPDEAELKALQTAIAQKTGLIF